MRKVKREWMPTLEGLTEPAATNIANRLIEYNEYELRLIDMRYRNGKGSMTSRWKKYLEESKEIRQIIAEIESWRDNLLEIDGDGERSEEI